MPHDLSTGRWWRFPALALGAVLVLAACGGSNDASTPSPTSTIPEVTPPVETDAPLLTPEDAAVSVVEQIPGRPDAPAAEDEDFRSDPATLVGATGRPQLVEFFTYW